MKAALTDRIDRMELARIKRDRERLRSLKADVGVLSDGLRQREQDLIVRVEAGVPVDGTARVTVRRSQNISWLTVVREQLGDDAIIDVKNEWPITFYKELQIS